MEMGIPEEEVTEDTVRKHKRFSLPAVALQTTNVTARSGVVVAEERRGDHTRHHRLSRRLSLVLASGGDSAGSETDLSRGMAAEKLSDLLGRTPTTDTNIG